MSVMRRFSTLLVLTILMLALEGDGWAQCAMCRTALENSVEGQQMAEGFRQGIVFLLAAPYAILGGFTYALVQAFRRRNRD